MLFNYLQYRILTLKNVTLHRLTIIKVVQQTLMNTNVSKKGKYSGTSLLIHTPLPLPIVFSFGPVGAKKTYSIFTMQLSTFFYCRPNNYFGCAFYFSVFVLGLDYTNTPDFLNYLLNSFRYIPSLDLRSLMIVSFDFILS